MRNLRHCQKYSMVRRQQKNQNIEYSPQICTHTYDAHTLNGTNTHKYTPKQQFVPNKDSTHSSTIDTHHSLS